MDGINHLSSNALSASIVWGIAVIVLYLYPFVLYFKYFFDFRDNSRAQRTDIEIIGAVFIKHIIMYIILYVAVVAVSHMVNPAPEYKPCAGIRLFFWGLTDSSCSATNVSNIFMYDVWSKYVDSSLSTVEIINSYTVGLGKVLFGISIAVMLFTIFIIFFIFAAPVLIGLRDYRQKKEKGEPVSSLELAFKIFLMIILFFTLMYIHLMISTNFVTNVANVSGFSYMSMMQNLIKEFLGI